MNQYFRIAPSIFITLTIAFAQMVKADCPTDFIKPFAGTWQGTAVLTTSNGTTLSSGTRDIVTIHGCNSFEVSVNYLDSSGNISRSVHFNANTNEFGEPELFTLEKGTITEGLNASPMTGTIQRSQEGNLLGQFSGAIGGRPAFLSEVMNLNGKDQLVRTIQMSAHHLGGNDIGTRVVHDSKVH